MANRYYAHTAEDAGGKRLPESQWQPLKDHLQNVAKLAKQFGEPLGLGEEAYLAGLLHDLGKYQSNFQRYLVHGSPRTPHAIHGGAVLSEFRLLANLIASHHAGLHDEGDDLTALLNKFIGASEGKTLLQSLLSSFKADQLNFPPKPRLTTQNTQGDTAEDLRLRLLLSVLSDADYLDTEEHFLRAKGQLRPSTKCATIPELLRKLNEHLGCFAATPNPAPLNQLRTRIAARCAEAGRTASTGTFSLTVPTGGGKTLASAAFALNHAAVHGFSRVIYVIPYTSIIEQNARVFASVFGAENILEHHSLADWQTGDETEASPDSIAARAKLASENWDAPFILTTNVQFFESLHSHRPSAVRKLHRLIGSVVLFDECQTFPPELLDPSLATLQALQKYGKTTLVFCTATQPAFQRREFFSAGFPTITEIIPDDPSWRLHERKEFRRTRIRYRSKPIALDTFADRIAACNRALAIVNTRHTARELFEAVQTRSPGNHVFHLSTFMCPAHRQAIFDTIRTSLAKPIQPCLVISTQLIEAGVDLDFPKVFRVLGPLDAVLQAAGRCNREGRLTNTIGESILGDVEVVCLADATLPPGIYQRATILAEKFLPTDEGGDISPDTIHNYFRELYHDTERDKHHIAHLRAQRLHRTIGLKYRWIEEDQPTESVLTEYNDDARVWINVMENQGYVPPSQQQRRATARLSINLRASDVEKGIHAGLLRQLHCGIYLTQNSYDPKFGYNSANIRMGEHMIF